MVEYANTDRTEAADPITLPAVGNARKASSKSDWIAFLPVPLLASVWLGHRLLPDRQEVGYSAEFGHALLAALVVYAVWLALSFFAGKAFRPLRSHAPIAAAIIVLLAVWNTATLKLDALPLPYFPSPAKMLDALFNDGQKLFVSTLYSLRLLLIGYLVGLACGLATGLLMGWYTRFRYWVNPLLRFVGPIPATAWIPVVLLVFPTTFTASLFLIALGTWFPVTIMTWSGIASVRRSLFEVAKTLGAKESYLIFRVALPAAMPLIFIGLFMGLGSSFVTLVVAEMLGVKAGIGFYLIWAEGWAEYYKVYSALLIIAILSSTVTTLLFKVRNRVLLWQKGLIRW